MDEGVRKTKQAGKDAFVIAGGPIEKAFAAEFLAEHIKEGENPWIIAADRGLEFLHEKKIRPTHIIGDFDSLAGDGMEGLLAAYAKDPKIVFRRFQPQKDDTDTEIALRLACELKSRRIFVLGATGGRMDHTVGAVQCLGIPLQAGIPCFMLNRKNRIRLLGRTDKAHPYGGACRAVLHKDAQYGKYVSLFPLTTTVEGLSLKGFAYTVRDFTLEIMCSRGVSNEIVEETAEISFGSGILLMVESSD